MYYDAINSSVSSNLIKVLNPDGGKDRNEENSRNSFPLLFEERNRILKEQTFDNINQRGKKLRYSP